MSFITERNELSDTTVDRLLSGDDDAPGLLSDSESLADEGEASIGYMVADALSGVKVEKKKKKSLLTQRQPMPGPGSIGPDSASPSPKKKKKKKGLFGKIKKGIKKASKSLGIKDAVKFIAKNPIVKVALKATPGAAAAMEAFKAASGKGTKKARQVVDSDEFTQAEGDLEQKVRSFASQYGLNPEDEISTLMDQFAKLKADGKIKAGSPVDQVLTAAASMKVAVQSVENEETGRASGSNMPLILGGVAVGALVLRKLMQ